MKLIRNISPQLLPWLIVGVLCIALLIAMRVSNYRVDKERHKTEALELEAQNLRTAAAASEATAKANYANHMKDIQAFRDELAKRPSTTQRIQNANRTIPDNDLHLFDSLLFSPITD